MRVKGNTILSKDGSGSVTLLPEEPEDMWHAYNLIRPTDLLTASTIRKVLTDAAGSKTSEAATSRSSKRVHMTLTIRVHKLDFDPKMGQLHVAGQVAAENEHVSLGSHHTLDLELHRTFKLEKVDGWDSVAQGFLKQVMNQGARAQLWAVVMQEGLANICLVTEFQTILKQKVEMSFPQAPSERDKRLPKFFQTVWETLLRQLNLDDLKPLLLASPGYTASKFQQFINKQVASGTDKRLVQLAAKITIANTPSAYVHHLTDVLRSRAVASQINDTKFARATQLIDRFMEMTRKGDAKAWYGPKECEAAIEQGAVGKGGGVFMISNELFRAQEIEARKRWVAAVDEVKAQGGEVVVMSSLHESGARLAELGGLAVILTYPIEDINGEFVEGGEDLPEDEMNGDAHGTEGFDRPGYEDDMDAFM